MRLRQLVLDVNGRATLFSLSSGGRPSWGCRLQQVESLAMKLSARNIMKGTVVKVVPGSVNAEVTIRIADGLEIVSMVSKTSVEQLGLKPGAAAYAIIKASNVILGVD
jgi:molybdopterin-binding protein